MNTPAITTEAQKRISTAAKDKGEVLFSKLYNLTEIVKLAAFASESKRVLEGIRNASEYRPEMQKAIRDNVTAWNNWSEMDDATSSVLAYAVIEMEAVNDQYLETVYDVANVLKNGAAAMTDTPASEAKRKKNGAEVAK